MLLPPDAHGQFLPTPLHGEEEKEEGKKKKRHLKAINKLQSAGNPHTKQPIACRFKVLLGIG